MEASLRMVVGNRTPDTSGSILYYRSKDAVHWEFINKLASCHNQYGKMWECPDFFPLDGKHVLLTSPQEMNAVGGGVPSRQRQCGDHRHL